MSKKVKKQAKKLENKTIAKKSRPLRPEEIKKEFSNYFVRLSRKLSLPSEMETVLWAHLKAAGYDKVELFDKGIEHFGYKLNK